MLSEAEFARSLTEVGLFGKHLTTRLAKVERDAHPTEVLQSLVNSPQPIRFDLATTAKLDGMGLQHFALKTKPRYLLKGLRSRPL